MKMDTSALPRRWRMAGSRSCVGAVSATVEGGTGEHLWLCTLEHACLELPFAIGRQMHEITERRIKPVQIGYRWWLPFFITSSEPFSAALIITSYGHERCRHHNLANAFRFHGGNDWDT